MQSSSDLRRYPSVETRHSVAERIRTLAADHPSARFDWMLATAISECIEVDCTTQAEWASLTADLIDWESCGFAVGWRCSECGEELNTGMSFCPNCGRRVTYVD
jgi:hypothetical protein